jgi:hypothetical protein
VLPTDATVLAMGLDIVALVGSVALVGHAGAAVLAVRLDILSLVLALIGCWMLPLELVRHGVLLRSLPRICGVALLDGLSALDLPIYSLQFQAYACDARS